MADLPLLQSGRVEAAGIPGAVLPTVNAPQVDYVGLKAGAQYQNTVSQTLDRLSNQLFGIAKTAATEAGLQYAADNPLTDEQLQAAKMGDLGAMKSGGALNIFDHLFQLFSSQYCTHLLIPSNICFCARYHSCQAFSFSMFSLQLP